MIVRNIPPPKSWKRLKYHPGQWAAITSKARFINLFCGRRSGKTELARRKVVLSLPIKKPWAKPIYVYALPTYQQAKRIAWRELLELIPKGWVVEQNVMDLWIKTIFGSELYVVGMDKPQRIEGLGYDGIVIDEACDHKPDSYALSIRPALADKEGWCWRIGVPKRSGSNSQECKEVFDKGLDPLNLDMESYTWESADILSPEEIAAARAELDEKSFNEQFRAKWEQAGGLIFYTFDDKQNISADLCQYRPDLPLCIGQDFNVDPMCWVIGQIITDHPTLPGKKVLIIFDELFIHNTNTPKALEELLGRYEHHKNKWRFYPDASSSSEKTSAAVSDYVHIINFCKKHGLDFSMHNHDKNPRLKNRFSMTNATICNTDGQRRLFIHPRARRLIADMNYRAYKEGTMEPNDADKNIGHASDALGYLCCQEFPLTLGPTKQPSVIIRSF